jgi:4-hydroxy-tetrahydrodipicolinate synthase
MTHQCLKGNYPAAAALQLKYLDLIDSLFCEVNPIPVKTALNLMGFDVGELRMPLCEMEPKNLDRLRRSLQAVGLLAE